MPIISVLRKLIVMNINILYILFTSVKNWNWDAVTVENQAVLCK